MNRWWISPRVTGEADVLAALGDTYCLAGQTDAARAAWERALSLYGDVDQPEVERIRALLNDL